MKSYRYSDETVLFLQGDQFSAGFELGLGGSSLSMGRIALLAELCRRRRVIHVGCADHLEIIEKKRAQGIWLHESITRVAGRCVGVDVNRDAINYLRNDLGFSDVFIADVANGSGCQALLQEQWDVILLPELIEHIGDPLHYLTNVVKLWRGKSAEILLSAPNAFDLDGILAASRGCERVNSDHFAYYSPYTIGRLLRLAGAKPREYWLCTSGSPSREGVSLRRLLGEMRPSRMLRRLFPLLRPHVVVRATLGCDYG